MLSLYLRLNVTLVRRACLLQVKRAKIFAGASDGCGVLLPAATTYGYFGVILTQCIETFGYYR